MFVIEHLQTIELVSLEQENETLCQVALDDKARALHLEQEKVKWSQQQKEFLNKVVVLSPTTEVGPNTEGLV
jgi:hypothetical protein